MRTRVSSNKLSSEPETVLISNMVFAEILTEVVMQFVMTPKFPAIASHMVLLDVPASPFSLSQIFIGLITKA